MESGETVALVASRHDEWDLMYRKGLTASRIAEACGVVTETVARHIRVRRAMYPDMETEHLSNRPVDRPRPVGPGWQKNIAALAACLEANGRYPTSSDPDPRMRRLAQWLSSVRRQERAGRLTTERREMLSVLPNWSKIQRTEEDAERWHERLGEVEAFMKEEGRWPRYRKYSGEAERVLGVWLHAQRQKASTGVLSAVERRILDVVIPGWNTWAGKDAGAA